MLKAHTANTWKVLEAFLQFMPQCQWVPLLHFNIIVIGWIKNLNIRGMCIFYRTIYTTKNASWIYCISPRFCDGFSSISNNFNMHFWKNFENDSIFLSLVFYSLNFFPLFFFLFFFLEFLKVTFIFNKLELKFNECT